VHDDDHFHSVPWSLLHENIVLSPRFVVACAGRLLGLLLSGTLKRI
jgi:hypothetical protein